MTRPPLLPAPRRRAEPVIGLINVVFLMLVFFLLAGTIAPPGQPGLQLVRITDPGAQAPQDALVLTAEGTLLHRGAQATVEGYLASLPAPATARLMPDQDAPAALMVATANRLAQAGASRVVIIGEKWAD